MNPESEPLPETDPSLSGILDELISREPIFHRPEWGTSRAVFEQMTASDFWETGASGRRYSRDFVLSELERRYPTTHAGARPDNRPDTWQATGFRCRQLAPDVFLLTYTLLQDHSRKTRRVTIWQRTPEGWKIVYHQGTIVQDS